MVPDAFTLYRQDAAGFDLPLPPSWETSRDVPDCALACAGPSASGELPPHIVISVEPRGDAEPVGEWVERLRGALVEAPGLRVIDVEDDPVGELPTYRTLCHYVHPRFGGVCLEQWAVSANGTGYVLSCSVGALEYDALADVFHHVASGLRVRGSR